MRKLGRFIDRLVKNVAFSLITLTIVAIFIVVNPGYFFRNQEEEEDDAGN